MKFRWTRDELKAVNDQNLIQTLIDERKSSLNPYSPLYKRLTQLEKNLVSISKLTEKK